MGAPEIRVFNTLQQSKVPLQPLTPGKLGIYVCGPTVYSFVHIGNARTFTSFDTVVRYLRYRGFEVRYVRNYTDVDDKIIKAAKETGEDAIALAARFVREFEADAKQLRLLPPDVSPKVSETIPEIVAIIEKLVANGAAYPSGGDVYFEVRKYPEYLKLSKKNLDDLRAGGGERELVHEQKRDPADFALWKGAKPGEPSWPSPWGAGRPGWHIECSAMSEKYLGETFDLHGGGLDLIFPHHENEIAQSEAASGKTLCNCWMHGGFLDLEGAKMSKSLGNVVRLRDALGKVDAEALRYFFLSTHYRQKLEFSDKSLADAETRMEYFYETLKKVDERIKGKDFGTGPLHGDPQRFLAEFDEHVSDDFNFPGGLGALSGLFGELNLLTDPKSPVKDKQMAGRTLVALREVAGKISGALGLFELDPSEWLLMRRDRQVVAKGIDRARVEEMVAARDAARAAKNYAESDRIRTEARGLGVEMMDSPSWDDLEDRRVMLGLALAVLAAAPASAFNPIDAAELRGHIRFLASDLLEGRGPATRGDRLAQQYIAGQFEAMGLEPGAPDGGWVQEVELVGVNGHPETMKVKGASAALTLKSKDDFIVVSGHQEKASTVESAPLVFIGYGITAPEYEWDNLKGADLAGKVLVVMNNDPEDDPTIFAGRARLYYGRWAYKFEQARKLGALGCLIIHTTPSAGYPWQVVQTSWSGEQFDLPSGAGHQLQLKGWLTEAVTKKLFASAGKNLDQLRALANTRKFAPVPLGLSISTSFTNGVARRVSGNVLGVLRGSDAQLKNEYVVYTAHHDHLGKKEGGAPGEDVIYNGAVDNASGVAAMLTLARVMSAQPKAPKRSVIFAAVAAEEQGLLGSQFLVEHPPVPTGRMAANLNLDGLNIWGRTRDLSVIGLGKSSLDGLIVELAAKQGRQVKPDALADRGFFYRSDQFNFAKQGVPSAYFSSGQDFIGRPEGWGRAQREKWEATHYHQPSDELRDTWDLSGAIEDVQLFLELGLSVGNAPTLPTWTKGDEFEAARKRALESSGRLTQP